MNYNYNTWNWSSGPDTPNSNHGITSV